MISKGVSYILLATLSFACMNAMVKNLSDLPAMEVVFFRTLGTLVFILPYMLVKKISIVGKDPKLLFLRAIVGFISLATFFIALQRIPLGSAISIRYLGPIFGALLAYLFLKERVNFWQWLSFGIAFSGVLVLKGFDLRIDNFSLMLLLISAFTVGMVFVLIRFLGKTEHPLTIINYFMLVAMSGSLLFASNWRMPIGDEWKSVLSIGIFGLIGQVFMTSAFQLEETSVLAPFKYMELVFALLIGFTFFGESYSTMAFSSIVLIIAGMLVNVRAKRLNEKAET